MSRVWSTYYTSDPAQDGENKLASTVSTAFCPVTRLAILAAGMLLLANASVAVVNTGTDDEALLPYWEVAEPGVSIRIVQRLPDQTRGFFQARGFSVESFDPRVQRHL